MQFYNDMTMRKEEFVPIEEGKVRMYCCGPTVYNFIHVGNPARIVRRAGEKIDYVREVDHVHDVADPLSNDLAAIREELARLKTRELELEARGPDNWII